MELKLKRRLVKIFQGFSKGAQVGDNKRELNDFAPSGKTNKMLARSLLGGYQQCH